jgi:hypothetical protein
MSGPRDRAIAMREIRARGPGRSGYADTGGRQAFEAFSRHHGQMAIEALLAPPSLWTREEVISRPSQVPKTAGVYAWYFRQLPGAVSVDGCHRWDGMPMLYVGIAPKRPYRDGRQSKSHLHQRVRYHYTGNAEGSTLRLTLGSLLSDALGIQLRRVGSGTRRTFSDGEQRLSEWMAENAFVCRLEDGEPWFIEELLIERYDIPLNLDQNKRNRFHPELTAARDIDAPQGG